MLKALDGTLQVLNSPYRVDDVEQHGRKLVRRLLHPETAGTPHNGQHPPSESEALKKQMTELLQWLQRQPTQPSTYLHGQGQAQLDRALLEAAALGAHHIVPVLLNLGADHDARDDYGNIPLHLAVAHPAVVKQLINAGADPGARNQQGKTAAALAKQHGYLATWEMLLADPSSE